MPAVAGPSTAPPYRPRPTDASQPPVKKRQRSDAPSASVSASRPVPPDHTSCHVRLGGALNRISMLEFELTRTRETISQLETKQAQADVFASTVLARLLEVERKGKEDGEKWEWALVGLGGTGPIGEAEQGRDVFPPADEVERQTQAGPITGITVANDMPLGIPIGEEGRRNRAELDGREDEADGMSQQAGWLNQRIPSEEPRRSSTAALNESSAEGEEIQEMHDLERGEGSNRRQRSTNGGKPNTGLPPLDTDDASLERAGWIIRDELFGDLPINYNTTHKFYRCTICKVGIRGLLSHFKSGGSAPHTGMRDVTPRRFATLLKAYPECDPYTLLPPNLSATNPLPFIPGILHSAGYSCNLCNYYAVLPATMQKHRSQKHRRTEHPAFSPSEAPGVLAEAAYSLFAHLQAFNRRVRPNACNWFPSSAPPVNLSSSTTTTQHSPGGGGESSGIGGSEDTSRPQVSEVAGDGSGSDGAGVASMVDDYESEVEEELEWRPDADDFRLPPASQNLGSRVLS